MFWANDNNLSHQSCVSCIFPIPYHPTNRAGLSNTLTSVINASDHTDELVHGGLVLDARVVKRRVHHDDGVTQDVARVWNGKTNHSQAWGPPWEDDKYEQGPVVWGTVALQMLVMWMLHKWRHPVQETIAKKIIDVENDVVWDRLTCPLIWRELSKRRLPMLDMEI